MSIIIDLVVIGILLLSIFLGYKKGLIGVAFKIASFFIAIVVTLILFIPVSNIVIKTTNFDETIKNTITQKLGTAEIEDGKIKKEDTDLPNIIVDYINEGIQDTVNQTKDAVIETVAQELSITGIRLIVMIAIFIITKLLLLFAKTILEAIAELPLIKQFNEVGGIIYGIIRGILIIYIALAIISLIIPMLGNTQILNEINKTILTKILYNNNLILMIFFR